MVLELHSAFRAAQEEAFEQWDAWQQAMEDENIVQKPRRVENRDASSLNRLIEYAAAASEKPHPTQGEPPQDAVAFERFARFEIEGIPYEALRKAGSVFLRPTPIPAKTHLFLNEKEYILERVEGDENLCQVVHLKSADLQSFLGRRSKAPDQYQIRFEQ
jgi:hypothetical protein